MHSIQTEYPNDKKALYAELRQQVQTLTEGVTHNIANLANVSAILNLALRDINWVGFYLLEKETLVLGPFQGKPACIEIPVGRGVCGTCVKENATQLVPDVHTFPGHIACDSASRSEIVVPIRVGGRIVGVLDIDSPLPNRFDADDRSGLESVVKILESSWIRP